MERRSRLRLGAELLVVIATAVLGAHFLAIWTASKTGVDAFDIYSYYLPNMRYAAQRLSAGGSGLLWNPFQDCGQPSLGISSTGILYPANVVFLFLPPGVALRTVTLFNLVVAGLGTYALCRELGLGRLASWCGAATFELGNATIDLTTWGPQMGGPYVWLPAAMWCCERLIRRPSLRTSIGLAATLALPLLPGFPQAVVYAYQLIALRVAWALVFDRMPSPMRSLGLIGLGLVLAPMLVAAQLLPAVEMAALSVRGGNLAPEEIRSLGFLSWKHLQFALNLRQELFNPLIAVPAVIAAASWLHRSRRSVAVFYTLAGFLYFALSFGPNTPLFELYEKLPLGRLFREPARMYWLPSFCLAVLTALGVDAMLARDGAEIARRRRYVGAVVCASTLLALHGLYPNGLKTAEWILGTTIVASVLAAALAAGARTGAGLVLAGAVTLGVCTFPAPFMPAVVNEFATRIPPLRRLVGDDGAHDRHAGTFAAVRAAMTPQDRLFFIYKPNSYSVMPKTASLFSVPAVQDYEPQAAQRYAEYFTLMRTGRPMGSLNDFYYPIGPSLPVWHRRRLLDLAAARYVLAESPVDNVTEVMQPPPALLIALSTGSLRVYENARALPRARYVPRLTVVQNPQVLLHKLADGNVNLREIAFVEEPPPSGFLGFPWVPEGGSVEFLRDDPEHVVLRVQAPMRGFLHLADQHYPGWYATVNGSDAPILRANFLFRAVEVPEGESVVEFRFTPWTVRLGAAVSAVTLLGVLAVMIVDVRRRGARP